MPTSIAPTAPTTEASSRARIGSSSHATIDLAATTAPMAKNATWPSDT